MKQAIADVHVQLSNDRDTREVVIPSLHGQRRSDPLRARRFGVSNDGAGSRCEAAPDCTRPLLSHCLRTAAPGIPSRGSIAAAGDRESFAPPVGHGRPRRAVPGAVTKKNGRPLARGPAARKPSGNLISSRTAAGWPGPRRRSGGPAATGRAGPRYSAALPEVSASSFSARARLPAASIFFSSLASTRSLIDWFQ